jgi:methionyl aminopeptidase
MSIETAEELAGMERAGKVTRAVLNVMKTAVRPGISTRELDEVGAAVMRSMGARSAPKPVYSFPGENCISVNEEIVHGVPGERKLINGDLVKLDVTVEVGGFMADACETIGVGSIKQESKRLIDCVSCLSIRFLCSTSRGAGIRHREGDSQNGSSQWLLCCA